MQKRQVNFVQSGLQDCAHRDVLNEGRGTTVGGCSNCSVIIRNVALGRIESVLAHCQLWILDRVATPHPLF